MTQKEIEEQQRKILFARFQKGTLERKMDTSYGEEEPAKPAEPAKSVPYDYQFDFKYLLGNYYKAYRNDKYYNDMKNDMKDECAEIKELERESAHDPILYDPILLWYIYRNIDKKTDKKNDENEKNVRLFDCDSWNGSNDLMDEIYDRLWRNKMNKWGCSSSHDKFGGDTMNSFATTFNAFSGKESYEESFDDYKEKKESYDVLREYAKLTGCLGNFVLVPKGFNGYRGLAGTIRDYWDLSLHELRCDRSGQGWLDQVDMPFNKYINLFFLWDYVSGKKNGGYRVRPLFKSHEAILMREKMVLPRKADGKGVSDDFSEFTKKANRCILRRGAFMSAMLRISAEDSDSYDKIVDCLATDASLGSMEDVIEQLQLKALPLDEKAKDFLDDLLNELETIEQKIKENATCQP